MPVHDALDNLGVVRKANHLLQLAQKDSSWRGKDFLLQNDGDLWQIYWDAIVARNPHTVRISWTKGHALENKKYLEQHPEKLQEAIWNNRADRLADRAHDLFFNPNTLVLSSLLADRVDEYVVFIQAVHQIIIRAHFAAVAVRQSVAYKLLHPDEQQHGPKLFVPPPTFLHLACTSPLTCKVTMDMMHAYLTDASKDIQGLVTLLTHVPCEPAGNSIHGHTWLEIMLLAIAWGTSHHRYDKAAPQPTIIRRLRTFQTQAWSLFKYMLHPDGHQRFKVSH
eukprot:12414807-Karenia_brevis.AAC.1